MYNILKYNVASMKVEKGRKLYQLSALLLVTMNEKPK